MRTTCTKPIEEPANAPALPCPRCRGTLIVGARIAVCAACGLVLAVAELP